MKPKSKIEGFVIPMLFNLFVTLFISLFFEMPGMISILLYAVITFLMARTKMENIHAGILRVGVFQDVWVSWIMEKFYAEFPFLSKMRNLSEHVNNDIINLREVGADPEVYINNNTYPILAIERDDAVYPISLDKYETVNTAITLKESQRLNYDKVMSATDQHQKALMDKAQQKWTHALGAMGNAANTPVLVATGALRVDGTKKLTAMDVLALQIAFDNLLIPKKGRVLCLSTQHMGDLVAEDIARFKSLADLEEGKFFNAFGFSIFSSNYVPKYHKTALTKNAFGAAATGNDAFASIAWHEGEAGYAKGSMTMHYLPKDLNTAFRRDEVGFTMFGIALPLRGKFIGAIVSGT